ncbi:MAG: hypothetical protein DLM67_05475 [Candidatus Nephthysia bennettiae]|uniref:Uncharacterized protein n=1 Tax=Candidatus Nephthysia bennettiae TaxID=3127016 RepID=A0A934K9F6_9BACT|nr:hypothetical protein [Candidatus Dormibacteraeota bacterium]MBJ7614578.1 hypothetical protein [Candidatus Dormibacteraeota bacterium]PZR98559.1 MAG: hypothetical protein DLM67_05475 [Candidatus Dormibacteraeota bacterium]
MSAQDRISPEVAAVLAAWAGLPVSASPEPLAETLEGVRQVVERLYAVDVTDFDLDFMQPDARAR